jgi:isopenicillin-N epimerase
VATFQLDTDVCFLNHGSFGACPVELLDEQDRLRRRVEREPVDFLVRQLPGLLGEARSAVSGFLGTRPEQLAFVRNATTGVNAVLGSLELRPGDELLTTDHRYQAVRNAMERVAKRAGARVVEAEVPYPLASPDQVYDAVAAGFSERTRLLVVDWITSATALILPIQRLVELARSRGVPVLVDGAHAPGQVDVDLSVLGADFFTGNLHKWLCAPRGAAVLAVAPQWVPRIHHPVTSHGYGEGLHAELDWVGSDDPTPWLCAPMAIAMHQAMGGAALRERHHTLVQAGRVVVAEALTVELPHPDDPSMYGAMAVIPLPDGFGPATLDGALSLNRRLFEQHRVEVPIICWFGRLWVRISGFAAYNRPEDYGRLAEALLALRMAPASGARTPQRSGE